MIHNIVRKSDEIVRQMSDSNDLYTSNLGPAGSWLSNVAKAWFRNLLVCLLVAHGDSVVNCLGYRGQSPLP